MCNSQIKIEEYFLDINLIVFFFVQKNCFMFQLLKCVYFIYFSSTTTFSDHTQIIIIIINIIYSKYIKIVWNSTRQKICAFNDDIFPCDDDDRDFLEHTYIKWVSEILKKFLFFGFLFFLHFKSECCSQVYRKWVYYFSNYWKTRWFLIPSRLILCFFFLSQSLRFFFSL